LVIAEDLAEEDDRRDRGCGDTIAGLADLSGDDPGDPFGREDLAEDELGVRGDGEEWGTEL
jgi:hypothetical protein